jgi:hypothetical protein
MKAHTLHLSHGTNKSPIFLHQPVKMDLLHYGILKQTNLSLNLKTVPVQIVLTEMS